MLVFELAEMLAVQAADDLVAVPSRISAATAEQEQRRDDVTARRSTRTSE